MSDVWTMIDLLDLKEYVDSVAQEQARNEQQ